MSVRVLMTPALGTRDDNGVGNVIANYLLHGPKYGIEFVQPGEAFDVEIAHAGVKPFENPGGRNIAMLHGLYWGDGVAPYEQQANCDIVENIRRATAVTVPSTWVAEPLKRDMHLSPFVIPHGINWDEWQGGQRNDHVVLWAKNRSDAVCNPRPIYELAQIRPDIRFVSTFGRSLENLAVIGSLPRETMRAVIMSSSIYLSTTEETFGIATLEALAAGLPVLGYAWGGNLDMVSTGFNGYLAKPGDLDDLAYGLQYCLDNWEELSKNAREDAKKWSWDSAVKQLARLVEGVAEPPRNDVAIVIPVYNKIGTIRQAIDSALAQTVPCEVIVVDDGSTDGSVSKLLEVEGFEIITQENRGVAHARNVGIAAAEAEFVVCLDADDFMDPRFVETCLPTLIADNSVGISFTGITAHRADGSTFVSDWPNGFNFERQMAQSNQVPTCCLFRKSLWERLGGYRQRYAPRGAGAEDAEFWLRIGAAGYRAEQATREGLFNYRIDVGVTSSGYSEPPWLKFHPWAKDGRHPFASVAKPAGAAHIVRAYGQPVVSVIIPVGKGHAQFLTDALDSLEGQTFREWEAIAIFDGELPRLPYGGGGYEFYRAYPYVKVDITRRKGAGAARNRGLELARGEYILFLDADDRLEPMFLERTVRLAQETGHAVYTDYFGINPPDISPKETVIVEQEGMTVVAGELPEYSCELAQAQPDVVNPYSWCPINTLIPVGEMGDTRFDESLISLEDWIFFIELARKGVCFSRIAEPLWVYNFPSGTRRLIGQQVRDGIIENAVLKEDLVACKGCGGSKATAQQRSSDSMAKNVLEDGYLFAQYAKSNRGKRPLYGIAKPKEFYGMKQAGDKLNVKAADVALMGTTFVCGHCGRPFQANVRDKLAWCSCSSSQQVPEVATKLAPRKASPTRVTASPASRPGERTVAQVGAQVKRDDAARPLRTPDLTADDFTTINGIGPATAKALNDKGVRTFDQLKRLDETGLRVFGVPPSALPAIMEYINNG